MIDVQLLSPVPRVVLVQFEGEIEVAEVEGDRRFGDLVKSFGGAPFRVLCDFGRTKSMARDVAELFLRAQSFALKANLERDAFVTSDPIVRAQVTRIAHDTRRFHWLGPLRFFDCADGARGYLLR